MTITAKNVLITAVMTASMALSQQPSNPNSQAESDGSRITVRGCVRSERGSYLLIANKTGVVYALQGVGNKLQPFLRKEVEVTGESRPGSVRTGVRPEKAGSNPSDTAHGVDGVPLQVSDIEKDIRVIAKKCKAADAQ